MIRNRMTTMMSSSQHEILWFVQGFDVGVFAAYAVIVCATWLTRRGRTIESRTGVWSTADNKNVFVDPSALLAAAGIPDTAMNRAEALEWFVNNRAKRIRAAKVWIIHRLRLTDESDSHTIVQ